jgi:hypothetical protein
MHEYYASIPQWSDHHWKKIRKFPRTENLAVGYDLIWIAIAMALDKFQQFFFVERFLSYHRIQGSIRVEKKEITLSI